MADKTLDDLVADLVEGPNVQSDPDAELDEAELPVLAAKRDLFIQEYVIDHNGTQAAIRAGYSPKSAHSKAYKLLHDPEVRAAIAQREGRLADELGITKQWVLEKMREVVDTAMNGEPPNLTAANKALENLAKHRGMLTEKHEVQHIGTVYTLSLDKDLDDTAGNEGSPV